VDDEEDVRTTTETILKKSGFRVMTAASADDCLEKLKKTKPDLVLLDIMMPGTPVKKAVPQMGDVKICFLSVVREIEAKKEGLLEFDNVVGMIQKPFDIKELVKEVKKMIGD